MADTYKDKLKFKSKHIYKLCNHSWPVPCNKECPAFNFPWHEVPQDRDVKFWRTTFWRRYRHKVKGLIHNKKYDNIPLKPENYAWIIN